jgi:hypothetical protein
VLSKHTELGDAPGLLSHGDRTGNWASRRAATRRCCLPPGQMQSGSWRAGAGHRSGTARRRLTRHRWPSVPGPMRERSRETDEHKGEEDRVVPGRRSLSAAWKCPGFWAKDERRTTLDLLSGLTHEHLCWRATNEHRRTRTEKQALQKKQTDLV